MAVVGYARVSSTGQSLEVQQEKLKAAGCEKVFAEKRSGLDQARPELARCLEYVREGDTLVITKLDRLARSSLHLAQVAAELEQKGVAFKVLDQAIDTSTPTGKLLFHMLAAIAEFETAIRRERQMDGIKKAKEEGVYTGRLPKLTPDKISDLCRRRAEGALIRDLMREYGVSKATVYRLLGAAARGVPQPGLPE